MNINKTEALEALEAIKARHKMPGRCSALSSEFCECLLCLCDRVRDYIEHQEVKQ